MFRTHHGDCHCQELARQSDLLFLSRTGPLRAVYPEPKRRARNGAKKRGGFTLIEMAVTMAVMAVIIAIAVVNIGSSSHSILGREARKLAYFMELVHDEAVTRGKSIGVSFSGNTPVLWNDNGKEWVQASSEDDVGDGTVENGVNIAGAWVDGREVSETSRVEFNPSGSIAPYSLKLAFDGRETDLNGDIFGRVVIKEKPVQVKSQ